MGAYYNLMDIIPDKNLLPGEMYMADKHPLNVVAISDELLNKMTLSDKPIYNDAPWIPKPGEIYLDGEKLEEKEIKQEELINGFMVQAGKAQVGTDPFWLEVHLVDKDQYYISGNKNGVMTRAEIKSLRKNLKKVMNSEVYEYPEVKPKNELINPGLDFNDDGYNDMMTEEVLNLPVTQYPSYEEQLFNALEEIGNNADSEVN